jgi:3-hydroxyisobutyrate dehydrogenase-like beta-hydroxyacid dehydrogenase
MSDSPVGFVGLGVMGLPMAVNLSRAGCAVTVYDKDPAAVDRAVGAGSGMVAAASRKALCCWTPRRRSRGLPRRPPRITAMTFMATAEGLAIGKKSGLDPGVMTDVLNVSTGMSWISQTHIRQRILSRTFDDAFKLELMVKDIGIAMRLAADRSIPVPLSGVGQQLWRAAVQHAEKGGSISEMVRWVENMTGVDITAGRGESSL